MNAITAPAKPDEIRFTNMEAGLQLAYNVLDKQDVAFKYIIFLTDGFPTTYINRTNSSNVNSTTSIAGWNPYETESYDRSKANKDGYFCDTVHGVTCYAATSYSDKAAIRARELATSMKGDGVNIFSVGIDIGGQTIQEYLPKAGDDYSIVDRRGTTYEIGSATNTKAYAAWLGNKIAGGPNLTEETHRYANGDNANELKTAFNNIFSDIKDISGIHLTDADVIDPMGKNIEFIKLIEAQDDAISHKKGTDTLDWDLIESNAELINTDTDGARTVRYEVTYRVRLENEAAAYVSGSEVLTNDKAVLNFQTIGQTENEPLSFRDPSVKGYKGSFSFTKLGTDNSTSETKPLEGSTFELRHSDVCSVCKAAGKSVKIDPLDATSDEDGIVSFANIPSGHDYILEETSAALGYQLSDKEYAVNVSYGTATVDGKTWSADSTTVVNQHLLPCEVDFVVSKSLNYGDENGSADSSQSLAPEHETYSFDLHKLDPIYDPQDETTISGFTKGELVQTKNNHGTAAEFETIHFEQHGTYYFMISEAKGDDSTVKYDENYYVARVSVSGNQSDHEHGTHLTSVVDMWKFDGKTPVTEAALSQKPNYSEGDAAMAFTNVKSAPASVGLPLVTKTVDDETASVADQYSFQLKDSNGKVLQTITNGASGQAVLEKLTFDAPGTYNYTINEVMGTDAGIFYDETIYNVTVSVSMSEPGKPLVASVLVNDQAAPENITFNNVTKKASLTFYATKVVDDDKTPAADEYKFELHQVDENWENPQLVTEGASSDNGLVRFENGTVEFSAPGNYHFLVSEVKGSDPTVLYDSTVHKVTVVVTDEGNLPNYSLKVFDDGGEILPTENPDQADLFPGIEFGTILQSHYSPLGGEGAYKSGSVFLHFANFTRHTDVVLEGEKTLDGKTPAEGAFSFVLKDADGNEIETVKNDAEGHFRFETIELNYDKTNAANNEHVYYISEVAGTDASIVYDKAVYKVTVTLQNPAGTDPTTPLPVTVKYEKMLANGNTSVVEKPVFANETDSVLPDTGKDPLSETGDSINLALMTSVALASLVLVAFAFRKFRKTR